MVEQEDVGRVITGVAPAAVVAGPAYGAPVIGGAVPQRRVVRLEQVGRWLWPNVKLACRGCMYFLVVHV